MFIIFDLISSIAKYIEERLHSGDRDGPIASVDEVQLVEVVGADLGVGAEGPPVPVELVLVEAGVAVAEAVAPVVNQGQPLGLRAPLRDGLVDVGHVLPARLQHLVDVDLLDVGQLQGQPPHVTRHPDVV